MADRQVLLLDLVDDADLIARYEAWHAPGAVPAAVVRSIRAAGITAMDSTVPATASSWSWKPRPTSTLPRGQSPTRPIPTPRPGKS